MREDVGSREVDLQLVDSAEGDTFAPGHGHTPCSCREASAHRLPKCRDESSAVPWSRRRIDKCQECAVSKRPQAAETGVSARCDAQTMQHSSLLAWKD
jgi:hypothetical protein